MSVLSPVDRDLPSGLPVKSLGVVHIYRAGASEVVALRGVDLDVDAGERVALVGPSGSGKSTLLNLMGGLLRPSAGRLLIGEYDVGRLSQRELLRLRATSVGTVLQGAGRNLLPFGTAEDNIRVAQRAVRGPRRRALLPPRELLDALGLGSVIGKLVPTMSGGEQQRIALAVGLANGPGLLLADEPTSQLDREARADVLALLDRVNREFGTTIVLVTHDADVGHVLGRTVSMRDGRVGAEGRRGEQFAVVARDGSVQLPDDVREDWPPGTLVRVERDQEALRLSRRQL